MSPYYRWSKEWTKKELQEVLSKTLIAQSKTGFITPVLVNSDDFGELQFIQMEQEAKNQISNFNEVDFNNQMLCYGQLNYDLLEEVTQGYIKAVNSSQ